MQQRIREQIAELLVPHILEDLVEAVRRAPHKRVQQWTSEYNVDVPVPQIWEKSAEVVRSAPRVAEQLVEAPAEHAVELLVSQSWGCIVEVARVGPIRALATTDRQATCGGASSSGLGRDRCCGEVCPTERATDHRTVGWKYPKECLRSAFLGS